MIKIRTALVIFLCAAAAGLKGQVILPDSIRYLLEQSPKDSAYLVNLNRIAFDCLKASPELGREIASLSMKYSRDANFVRGYARALDVTGSSYWVVGDYESALNYYQLSARESGSIKDSVGLSSVYHNMGEVFKKVGDYNKSIEFLSLSLKWDKKDNIHTGITLYNIGEAYLMKRQLSEASRYFNDALIRAIADKDNRTLAYCYQGLGSVKFINREYYPALAYFTQAEKMWKEQGEFRSLIQTHKDFADVYISLGEFKKAEGYLLQGIQLATRIHAPDLQVDNYLNLSKLFSLQGDYRKAFDAMVRHNSLNDSVYNVKKTEHIAHLQTLFDSENRDRENTQLRAEKQLQESQIRWQQLFILLIGAGLLTAGILAWGLYRQHRKILEVNEILKVKNLEIRQQKGEIETQTKTLQELNAQLQELNKSLESRIEDRTYLLVRQNEKLSAYAYANAHQLRAPVVSILGLLSLIDRLKLPPEDHELVSHLIDCGQQLDRITREINRNLESEDLVYHTERHAETAQPTS